MTQDKEDMIHEPLIDDEEFKKLMEAAETAEFSADDIAMLQRVEDKLLDEISGGESHIKTKAKFGFTLDELKDVSFKRFLAIAAVVSLCVGVSVSLFMAPEADYEGTKGTEAVSLSVSLTLRNVQNQDALIDDELPVGTKFHAEIFSDNEAFASLVVFRNGARQITTPAEKLHAGGEVSIQNAKKQPLVIELQNPFDTYSVCVLATDSRARLTSLLNTYATEEALLGVGTCRKIKVVTP